MDTSSVDSTTALIGVLGVTAGALTTGGVQALIARWDRRRQARAAARLLVIALSDMRAELRRLVDDLVDGTGGTPAPRGEELGLAWEEARPSLAVDLTGQDFISVHHAVVRVAEFRAQWAEYLDEWPKANQLIEEQSRVAEDASRAAEELSRGVEELAQAIGEASRGVGEASRGVEEASRAAEELSRGVEDLKRAAAHAHDNVTVFAREVLALVETAQAATRRAAFSRSERLRRWARRRWRRMKGRLSRSTVSNAR